MPAKQISINLVGEEQMDHTPAGRIVTWAVTYGRYIMIGTEIVVLLAFISRFSLDRKLTDLKEEVTLKQAIIEANLPFEKDVRSLQDQLAKIKTLTTPPLSPPYVLSQVQSVLPQDVYLKSLDVNQEKITAVGVAGTTQGLSQFIANMQASPLLKQVDFGDVSRDKLLGVQFQFTAQLASKPK